MQAGVNISTNENTLEVKYGMYELGPEREGARTSLKYIYSDVNDIKTYYIRLGFHLDEFERCKYYEDFGFLTMAEFCEANLGMDKSAVSRCVNVFKEFAKRNGNYKTGNLTMFIDDKWSAYSYSQLCEMLPLDDKTRRQVTPDMSVKKIRELKKKNTAEPSAVATSQPNNLIVSGIGCNMGSVYSALMEIMTKFDNVDNLCSDNGKLLFRIGDAHYKITAEKW